MALTAGTRLGPYEIESLVGAGGMGHVYRARDTRLQRVVALKVLPDDRAADPEARQRFDREARAIAALNHPNVCSIHDVGLASVGSTGAFVPYLIMELLEGETLQQRLLRGPLSIEDAIACGAALADGLAAAHERGLIHRDLKPANIFLTSRGIPKILDFGLAKPLVDPAQDVTQANDALTALGTTLGTLAYMSPEQLRAEPLDARTDVFSFGLVLYEMATGERGFAGATAAAVAAAILSQEPVPPSHERPSVPPALEQLILKALKKHPSERYQSAAALGRELLAMRGTSATASPRITESDVARAAATVVLGPGQGPASDRGTPPAAAGASGSATRVVGTPVPAPAAAASASTASGSAAVVVAGAPAAAPPAARTGWRMAAFVGVAAVVGLAFWLGRHAPPADGGAAQVADGRTPATEAAGAPTVSTSAENAASTPAAGAPATENASRAAGTPAATAPPAGAAPPAAAPSVTAAPAGGPAGAPGAAAGRSDAPAPAPAAGATPPPMPPPPGSDPAGRRMNRGGSARGGRPGGDAPTPPAAPAAADRRVAPGAGMALANNLRTLPPVAFDLAFVASDPQARDLANQLRAILTSGGWTCVSATAVAEAPVTFGVLLPAPSPAAAMFLNWARRQGMEPDVRVTPNAPRVRLMIGSRK